MENIVCSGESRRNQKTKRGLGTYLLSVLFFLFPVLTRSTQVLNFFSAKRTKASATLLLREKKNGKIFYIFRFGGTINFRVKVPPEFSDTGKEYGQSVPVEMVRRGKNVLWVRCCPETT